MILLHCADQHLAPSGSKLDATTGMNARLVDRFRCAKFCVDDGLARGAAMVVSCGDLLNSPKPTPTELGLARQVIEAATSRDVPWIQLLGNHESSRSYWELHAIDPLRRIPGLTIVDTPCLLDVWRSGQDGLRVCAAGEGPMQDVELQLACLPFPNPQFLLRDEETRKLSPGDRNLLIRAKLMDCARGLAADRLAGVPRILLGHWSVDTAAAGTQNRLMLLGGEFTLNAHELSALGFDAVLLGHIHKRQEIGDLTVPVVYCGSPEACSFGEEGEQKGYYLHQAAGVDDPGGGTIQFIETPFRKLVTLSASDFQVRDDGSADWECEPFPNGAIVRLEIPPGSTLTIAEAVRAIEAAGAFEARVTKPRAETERRRETGVTHGMGLEEQLRAWLKQKPELQPLTEAIIAEALKIEEAVRGGAV